MGQQAYEHLQEFSETFPKAPQLTLATNGSRPKSIKAVLDRFEIALERFDSEMNGFRLSMNEWLQAFRQKVSQVVETEAGNGPSGEIALKVTFEIIVPTAVRRIEELLQLLDQLKEFDAELVEVRTIIAKVDPSSVTRSAALTSQCHLLRAEHRGTLLELIETAEMIGWDLDPDGHEATGSASSPEEIDAFLASR